VTVWRSLETTMDDQPQEGADRALRKFGSTLAGRVRPARDPDPDPDPDPSRPMLPSAETGSPSTAPGHEAHAF